MRWSLSALSSYEKCPAQYKYRHIERLPVNFKSDAAARGTELHATIESFLKGTITELPNEINFYTQYLTQLKGREIYPEHKVALTRDWEVTEWDGDLCWYRGIFDLKISGAGDEVTIIDWKTGKIYPEHDDQKSLYSLAAFSESPTVQRVRAIHVYLDLGKNREKTYDRQQLHELRASWNSRVLKLEQETEWLPNPNFMCRYCSFSRMNGGPCKF